jgi:hypothetical protein
MKILIVLSLISFNSFAGLFDNKISDESKAELYDAIKKDNGQKIDEILKSKSEDPVFGQLKFGFGHKLLGEATYQKKSDNSSDREHNFACLPKAVKALIDNGAIPTESKTMDLSKIVNGHMTAAIISYCPESIKIISEKLSKDDIAKASMNFDILDEFANDEKIAPRIIETVSTLKNILEPICKSKVQNGCDAIKHLKDQLAQFETRENQNRFAETPQGKIQALRDRSCDLQIRIEEQLNIINNEKKIGKAVGVVDAKKLYDSGNTIETLKNELLDVNNDLKQMKEKPVPRKDCIVHH